MRVFSETMILLFPIGLIGTVTWIISDNLLASNGFLANVLYIRRWLPQRRFWQALFGDETTLTIGWLAAYAAFTSAVVTTKHHQRGNLLAGLCALLSYVLIFYHTVRGGQNIDLRYFGMGWLVIGVIVGYLVGQIFAKWGTQVTLNELRLGSKRLMTRVLQNLKAFTITFCTAFIIHLLYAVWRTFDLYAITTQNLVSAIGRHSNYLLNIILSFVNTVFVWLGFAEPRAISYAAYSNEVSNNLTYVLTHKSFNVPYPFTPSSLYSAFADFGGVGVTLALVIGILWLGRQKNQQKIAGLSVLPAVFNHGVPILLGTQVFMNPIYVFPFILLPIFNMLVASFFILVHLVPPVAYPILSGTPGILVPFIGTGGDWRALILSLLLVIIDTAIYIPFIKMAFAVENQLNEKEGASLK